jgi:NADH:ubiquinone oxidoreductase subunit E
MQVEEIWDAILSREAQRIREAFRQLSAQEQQAVMAHLDRMCREDGWHPEQVLSAQAALKALSASGKMRGE